MIGPRNSVVRELMGEHVPLDELLCDQSEFIDNSLFTRGYVRQYVPEFWVEHLHDAVYQGE